MTHGMSGKAVFLDRDNTIIMDCPYCRRREDVKLMDGAAEAIRLLNREGIPVIVLTNQSGIGRGYFTLREMEEVNDEMAKQLAAGGAHIDALYYCPHTPDDMCSCRKPMPGLIDMARRDFGSSGEFVIGDRDDIDGELARRAGLEYAIVGERGILAIVSDYLSEGAK